MLKEREKNTKSYLLICRYLQNCMTCMMHAKVEIAFSGVFGGVGPSPRYVLWRRHVTLFCFTYPDAGVYLDNGDVFTRKTLIWTSIPVRRRE